MKWWTGDSSNQLKKTVMIAVGLLLLVGMLSACALLPEEQVEDLEPVINPPKLSQRPEYKVELGTIETRVNATGRLMAVTEEELSFTTDNTRIMDVYVEREQYVEAGQVIARADTGDLDERIRQQELQLRNDELQMIEMLRDAEDYDPVQLEQAILNFEMKQAEFQKLLDQRESSTLYAPFSGTVIAIYAERGSIVNAYQPVVVMADLSELAIAVNVSQSNLDKVAIGMEAVVEISNLGSHRGKVVRMPMPPAEGVHQRNQNPLDQFVLIELDEFPEGAHRGTPLSAQIITERKENVVVVPPSVIRTHSGRNYVQVVEEDGTRREVDVELGIQTSTQVEVRAGLQPGQVVLGR